MIIFTHNKKYFENSYFRTWTLLTLHVSGLSLWMHGAKRVPMCARIHVLFFIVIFFTCRLLPKIYVWGWGRRKNEDEVFFELIHSRYGSLSFLFFQAFFLNLMNEWITYRTMQTRSCHELLRQGEKKGWRRRHRKVCNFEKKHFLPSETFDW